MRKKSTYQVLTLLVLGLSIAAQEGACAEFMRGADISIQTRQEADGVIYNEYGVPKDVLTIFKNHDLNWIRIRLFHTPNPSSYGASMDLAYVTALAARVKAQGFKFLLDFHYSDTWADPGHQTKPAAWSSLNQAQLVTAVHDYTRDVISHLRDNNAMPDMVQIGNEIICGMLWPNGNCCNGNWSNLVDLINAGISGVNDGRGTEPMPKIMIHIDRGGDWGSTQWFFDNLINTYGVQFDVIGQSFYPQWHGTLDDLTNCLNNTAATYPLHDIVVAEAGDYYTSSGKTPESQKAYLEGVIQRVQDTPGGKGIGVFYWEPTWVLNAGGVSNRALFAPISGNWRNVNMLMGMEAFDKIYGDITGNGIVDFEDLHDFFELWLEDDCAATAGLDLNADCVITFYEFSALAQNWLERE
jgi:arabinogalactan endo-1,4-beta-galactosidase